MFVTIMRTVRISDLRRGHLRGGFVPWLQVGFFPRSESAGCTIVTIEPPSPDRLSAGPYIYVRSAGTRECGYIVGYAQWDARFNPCLLVKQSVPAAFQVAACDGTHGLI